MESLPSDIFHLFIALIPPKASVRLLITSAKIKTEFYNSVKVWESIYDAAGLQNKQNTTSSLEEYQQALRIFFRTERAISTCRIPSPRLVAGTLPWLHEGAYPAISSLAELHCPGSIYMAWPDARSPTAAWGGRSASQSWNIINCLESRSDAYRIGNLPEATDLVFLGDAYYTFLPALACRRITPCPEKFTIYKVGSAETIQIPAWSEDRPSVLHPDFELSYSAFLKNQRGMTQTFGQYLQYHHREDSNRIVCRLLLYSVQHRRIVLDADLLPPDNHAPLSSMSRVPPVRLGGFLDGKYLIQSYGSEGPYAVYDLDSYVNGDRLPVSHWDPILSSTFSCIEPSFCLRGSGSWFDVVDASSNSVLLCQDQYVIFSGRGHFFQPNGIFLIGLEQDVDQTPILQKFVSSPQSCELISPGTSGSYFSACGPSESISSAPACHLFEIPSLKSLLEIKPFSELSWIDSHRALLLVRPAIFLIDFAQDYPPPSGVGGLFCAIVGRTKSNQKVSSISSRNIALLQLDMSSITESIIQILRCSDLSLFKCSETNTGYLIFGRERQFQNTLPTKSSAWLVAGHKLSSTGHQATNLSFGFMKVDSAVITLPQSTAKRPPLATAKIQLFPFGHSCSTFGNVDFVILGLQSNIIVDFDPALATAVMESIQGIEDIHS